MEVTEGMVGGDWKKFSHTQASVARRIFRIWRSAMGEDNPRIVCACCMLAAAAGCYLVNPPQLLYPCFGMTPVNPPMLSLLSHGGLEGVNPPLMSLLWLSGGPGRVNPPHPATTTKGGLTPLSSASHTWYEYFEDMVMPYNWHDLLMDRAPSNWRHLPDLPTCEPAERFNADQRREYLKGMVSDIVGWVPRVFDKPLTHVLPGLLRRTWDKFKDRGAVLLSHDQDAPEFPRGLRFLLSQAYQQAIPNLDDLGSMNTVLRMVGTDLPTFDKCSDAVQFYVTGCKSLANELGGEYAWMGEGGNRSQAMEYIPTVLSEKFNISITRFVNCLQLKSDRSKVPLGHLGSHPMNMALFLENPSNFVWRLTRYVELWLLFQTNLRYKSGHVVLMEALALA
jgi:hypothetical protein